MISFVENYIELNEKEKVLDSKAYLRLGQLLSMKDENEEKVKPPSNQSNKTRLSYILFKIIPKLNYSSSTIPKSNLYCRKKRVINKIKSEAAINYGMANAHLTWMNKQKEITSQFKTFSGVAERQEDDDEMEEAQNNLKRELGLISNRSHA